MANDLPKDVILKYFEYNKLPADQQLVGKVYYELAHAIAEGDNGPETGNLTFGGPLPKCPERTVALRKLLESREAAIRCFEEKGS